MKTKTKKQPKPSRPLGRFVWSASLSSQDGMPYVMWKRKQSHRHRPHLIIPMTKDGKCQRDDVLFVLGKAIAANGDDCYAAATDALTRLGWPET